MTIKEKIAIEVMRYQCTLTDIRERKTEGLWIADQILSTIIEEIRGVKNPYDTNKFPDGREYIGHFVWRDAMDEVIAKLEVK